MALTLALVPALLLQLQQPFATTLEYVRAVAPAFARAGVTVIKGCPPGMEGQFLPTRRTVCFDPPTLEGPTDAAIAVIAHESVHIAQWCDAGRNGPYLRRISDGVIGTAQTPGFKASLEREAYGLERSPQYVLYLLNRVC